MGVLGFSEAKAQHLLLFEHQAVQSLDYSLPKNKASLMLPNEGIPLLSHSCQTELY